MAKVSENSGKFINNKNSLRSVFIAAWPELVQFNCGNFLVCPFYFLHNKTNNQTNTLLLFVCFAEIKKVNPSISSEILVMIGSGRFRILNGNERHFFRKGDRILFRELFLKQILISHHNTNKSNCKQ